MLTELQGAREANSPISNIWATKEGSDRISFGDFCIQTANFMPAQKRLALPKCHSMAGKFGSAGPSSAMLRSRLKHSGAHSVWLDLPCLWE